MNKTRIMKIAQGEIINKFFGTYIMQCDSPERNLILNKLT